MKDRGGLWLSDTTKLSCMWSLGAGSRMRYGANYNEITAVHGLYVQLVDCAGVRCNISHCVRGGVHDRDVDKWHVLGGR